MSSTNNSGRVSQKSTSPKEAKVSLAERFPQLAERCKALNIDVKAEFGILDVELITGLGHSWIRKAITGYRGKGLRAAPQMHARKVSLDGGDISAWRVPIQDVAEKLAEVIEGRQHEADRFSNPAKYIADERRPSTAKAINTIARIAEEAGLSEEERALLAKLSARIKEVANS